MQLLSILREQEGKDVSHYVHNYYSTLYNIPCAIKQLISINIDFKIAIEIIIGSLTLTRVSLETRFIEERKTINYEE